MNNLNHIIESLLFVAEDPLTVDRLKTILETVETKEIRNALHALAEQYESRGGGFGLFEIAGGWQLRSRPEFNEWIKRMLQPPPQRLTKATLETLAIVAYNQPIIRADIEHIRGVDCGGVLRQLMERKLIRVLGRKEIPGRPLIYATTKYFLELFDLKDLKDLPTHKEIETMTAARENADESNAGTRPGDMLAHIAGTDFALTDGLQKRTFAARHAGLPDNFNQSEGYYQNRAIPRPGDVPVIAMQRPHVGAPPAQILQRVSTISTQRAKINGNKEKL